MDKISIKKIYTHFYKPASISNYPKGYEFKLISTEKQFYSLIEELISSYIACDLETTALDLNVAKIVGVSLSQGNKKAYYLPFRHKEDSHYNLPIRLLQTLYEIIFLNKKTLWYNFKYDGSVLDLSGYSIENMNVIDVQNLVWITDTNVSQVGLKWAAKHFLGWNMQKFEEVLSSNVNFSFISPENAKFYACSDAIATIELYNKLYPIMKLTSEYTIKLDNEFSIPFIRFHQEENYLDKNILLDVDKKISKRLPEIEKEIFTMCGRQFNIKSSEQVANTLQKMGIDTGEKCKNYMSTKADLLKKIDHPVGKKIVFYKQMSAWHNKDVKPILAKLEANEPIRFNYYPYGAPTGRLASGKDKNNLSYYAQMNIQSIVKSEKDKKYVYQNETSNSILGWSIADKKETEKSYPIEFPKQDLNIRNAFSAPDGWLFCKFDFSAEEIRIPANITGEPVWVNAFLNGEDIHSVVAKKVFGSADSSNRNKAKIISFGIIYGMTPASLTKRLNVTKAEGEEFYNEYKKQHVKLFKWIETVQNNAKKTGSVYTVFGRPRRLGHYFNSNKKSTIAFAYRSAVNSIIQGTASDILKISLIKLYRNVFKPYNNIVKFRMTVHDEVDVIIKIGYEFDMIDLIFKNMEFKMKNWPVPLEVGLEAGHSWGSLISFEKNKYGVLEPKEAS